MSPAEPKFGFSTRFSFVLSKFQTEKVSLSLERTLLGCPTESGQAEIAI